MNKSKKIINNIKNNIKNKIKEYKIRVIGMEEDLNCEKNLNLNLIKSIRNIFVYEKIIKKNNLEIEIFYKKDNFKFLKEMEYYKRYNKGEKEIYNYIDLGEEKEFEDNKIYNNIFEYNFYKLKKDRKERYKEKEKKEEKKEKYYQKKEIKKYNIYKKLKNKIILLKFKDNLNRVIYNEISVGMKGHFYLNLEKQDLKGIKNVIINKILLCNLMVKYNYSKLDYEKLLYINLNQNINIIGEEYEKKEILSVLSSIKDMNGKEKSEYEEERSIIMWNVFRNNIIKYDSMLEYIKQQEKLKDIEVIKKNTKINKYEVYLIIRNLIKKEIQFKYNLNNKFKKGLWFKENKLSYNKKHHMFVRLLNKKSYKIAFGIKEKKNYKLGIKFYKLEKDLKGFNYKLTGKRYYLLIKLLFNTNDINKILNQTLYEYNQIFYIIDLIKWKYYYFIIEFLKIIIFYIIGIIKYKVKRFTLFKIINKSSEERLKKEKEALIEILDEFKVLYLVEEIKYKLEDNEIYDKVIEEEFLKKEELKRRQKRGKQEYINYILYKIFNYVKNLYIKKNIYYMIKKLYNYIYIYIIYYIYIYIIYIIYMEIKNIERINWNLKEIFIDKLFVIYINLIYENRIILYIGLIDIILILIIIYIIKNKLKLFKIKLNYIKKIIIMIYNLIRKRSIHLSLISLIFNIVYYDWGFIVMNIYIIYIIYIYIYNLNIYENIDYEKMKYKLIIKLVKIKIRMILVKKRIYFIYKRVLRHNKVVTYVKGFIDVKVRKKKTRDANFLNGNFYCNKFFTYGFKRGTLDESLNIKEENDIKNLDIKYSTEKEFLGFIIWYMKKEYERKVLPNFIHDIIIHKWIMEEFQIKGAYKEIEENLKERLVIYKDLKGKDKRYYRRYKRYYSEFILDKGREWINVNENYYSKGEGYRLDLDKIEKKFKIEMSIIISEYLKFRVSLDELKFSNYNLPDEYMMREEKIYSLKKENYEVKDILEKEYVIYNEFNKFKVKYKKLFEVQKYYNRLNILRRYLLRKKIFRNIFLRGIFRTINLMIIRNTKKYTIERWVLDILTNQGWIVLMFYIHPDYSDVEDEVIKYADIVKGSFMIERPDDSGFIKLIREGKKVYRIYEEENEEDKNYFSRLNSGLRLIEYNKMIKYKIIYKWMEINKAYKRYKENMEEETSMNYRIDGECYYKKLYKIAKYDKKIKNIYKYIWNISNKKDLEKEKWIENLKREKGYRMNYKEEEDFKCYIRVFMRLLVEDRFKEIEDATMEESPMKVSALYIIYKMCSIITSNTILWEGIILRNRVYWELIFNNKRNNWDQKIKEMKIKFKI
jgi:hypothetical protein